MKTKRIPHFHQDPSVMLFKGTLKWDILVFFACMGRLNNIYTYLCVNYKSNLKIWYKKRKTVLIFHIFFLWSGILFKMFYGPYVINKNTKCKSINNAKFTKLFHHSISVFLFNMYRYPNNASKRNKNIFFFINSHSYMLINDVPTTAMIAGIGEKGGMVGTTRGWTFLWDGNGKWEGWGVGRMGMMRWRECMGRVRSGKWGWDEGMGRVRNG